MLSPTFSESNYSQATNASGTISTSVKVAVRVRPLGKVNSRRQGENMAFSTSMLTNTITDQNRTWEFDHVCDETVDQAQLFSTCVKNMVSTFIEGYNVTLFAYGQTSSGKSYTMGTSETSVNDNAGIVPRAFQYILDNIHNKDPSLRIELRMTYLELYNEDLKDLLSDDLSNINVVQVREDKGKILWTGAKEIRVKNMEEVYDVLKKGMDRRKTASTSMNQGSSRSHGIISGTLLQTKLDENGIETTVTSKCHFVDLAGSERMKRTGATGDRAKEGISINAGLSTLGKVIKGLSKPSTTKVHVPYRDSKLTRMLQDSLGGNCNTMMIACVSPAVDDHPETISTLYYASNARDIKSKISIEKDDTNDPVKLKLMIQILNKKLDNYKNGEFNAPVANSEPAGTGEQGFTVPMTALIQMNVALKKDMERLTKMYAELQTKHKALKSSSQMNYSNSPSRISSYMETKSNTPSDISNPNESPEESQAKLSLYKQLYTQVELQFKHQKDKNVQIQKELQEANLQLSELKKKFEDFSETQTTQPISRDIQETNGIHASDQSSVDKESVEQLYQTIFALKNKVEEFTQENSELRKKLEESNAQSQQLVAPNEQTAALSDSDANAKVGTLTKELEEYKDKVIQLDLDIVDLKLNEEELIQRNKKLTEQVSKNNGIGEDASTSRGLDANEGAPARPLTNGNSVDTSVEIELRKQLADMIQQLATHKSTLAEKDEQLQKLEIKLEEVQLTPTLNKDAGSQDVKPIPVDESQSEVAVLKEKLEKLQQMVEEKDTLLEHLELETSEHKLKIETSEASVLLLTNQLAIIQEAEGHVDSYKQEVQELQEELFQLKTQPVSREVSIEEAPAHQEVVLKFTKELAHLKTELTEKEAVLNEDQVNKQQLFDLTEELANLKVALNEKEATLNEVQVNKQVVSDLTAELEKVKAQLTENVTPDGNDDPTQATLELQAELTAAKTELEKAKLELQAREGLVASVEAYKQEVAHITAEMEQIKSKVVEREAQVDDSDLLRLEIVDLEDKLAASHTELEEAKLLLAANKPKDADVELYKKEIDELKVDLEKARVQSVEREILDVDADLHKQEVLQLQTELEKVKLQLNEKETATNDVESLEKEVRVLTDQLDKVKLELTEKETTVQDLSLYKQQALQLTTELEKTKSELTERQVVENEVNTHKEEIAALANELDKVKLELSEQQALVDSIDRHKEKSTELENKLLTVTEELNQAKTELSEKEAVLKDLNVYKQQADKLSAELHEVKVELAQTSSIASEAATHKDQVQELSTKLAVVQAQLEKTQSELMEKEIGLQSLTESKNDQLLIEQEDTICNLQETIATLHAQSNELQEANQRLQSQADGSESLRSQIEALQLKYSSLEADYTKTQHQLETQVDEVTRHQSSHQALAETTAQLQQNLHQLESDRDSAQQRAQQLETTNLTYQKELHDLHEILSVRENEVKQLEARHASLTQAATLTHDQRTQILKLESDLKDLKLYNQTLEDDNQELDTLKAQISQLQAKVQELEERSHQDQLKHKEEVHNLVEQLKSPNLHATKQPSINGTSVSQRTSRSQMLTHSNGVTANSSVTPPSNLEEHSNHSGSRRSKGSKSKFLCI